MVWLLAAVACRPGADPEPPVVDVQVDPDLPSVLHVAWDWDGPAAHHVEYGVGELDEQTPPTAEPGATVLGIPGGATVKLRVVVQPEQGDAVASAPVEVVLQPPPVDLPSWTVTVDDGAHQDPGRFMLLSWMVDGAGFISILDRRGEWVWWRRVQPGLSAVTVKPARDGRTILAVNQDVGKTEDRGQISHHPIRGGEVTATPAPLAHHDFVELPDGDLVYLAMDVRDLDLDGQVRPMRADALVRVTPGADPDPTTVFAVFDDLGRDPWFPCDHALPLEPTPLGDAHDFTHGNSLGLTSDGATLLYNSRYLDALFAVDVDSGAIRWQLGGEDSDFDPVGDTRLWRHGHVSDLRDDAMVMFDNATHADPEISAVVEYRWDAAAGTVEEVFRHTSDGWRVGILGDARKTRTGTYLVTWGSEGVVQEIHPEHGVVWEAVAPAGTLVSRVTLFEDLYRLVPRGGPPWDTDSP